MVGQGLDLLRALQQDAPARDRRTQANAQETQRGLLQDHRRDRHGDRDDDMAEKRGQQVPENNPHLCGPRQAGGHDKVLFTQGQDFPAHDARQARPPQDGENDDDPKVDPYFP